MMLVGYLDNFVGLLKALSEQNSLIRRGLTVFLLSSSHLNFTGLKEILPSLSPWLFTNPNCAGSPMAICRNAPWLRTASQGKTCQQSRRGGSAGGPWVSEPHPSAENPLRPPAPLPAGLSLRSQPRIAAAKGCHAPSLLTRLRPEQLLVNSSLVKPHYMRLCYKMGDNVIVNVTLTII